MFVRTALGWDLHRRFSTVSQVEQHAPGEFRVIKRARLEHADREAMRAWLAQLPPGTPVALEGAFGWPWVADLLTELGLDPYLGHPPALKVLAKNEAKSDRADADRLARFWLRGTFPKCYLSTPEVRQIRERVRYRMALARTRTEIKNRAHAVLHRHGILHDFSDLFGKGGTRLLEGSRPPGRLAPCARRLAEPAGRCDGTACRRRAMDGAEPGRRRDCLAAQNDSRHRPDLGTRDSRRGGPARRAVCQSSQVHQLCRAGAFGRRFGRSPRPATHQPRLQPYAALGLHRGSGNRSTCEELSAIAAILALSADAGQPRAEARGPGRRGPRAGRVGLRHLEERRT